MKVENTPRLRIELMDADDAQLLFELDQDPEVMRYINGGVVTTMEEINDVYLPRMAHYRNEEKGWGLWKVTVLDNNSFIGWILVRPMDFFSDKPEFENIELGWRFKQAAWGKGYATEAAKQIQDTLLKRDDVKAVSAIAVDDNIGSINIMKKLGMQFVKQYVHQDSMLGDMDVVYYRLSK